MLLFLVSLVAIAMLGLLLSWPESHMLSIPGVSSLSDIHSGSSAKAVGHSLRV